MSEVESKFDLSTISEGVKYLQDGYIEYCEEVISNRALPSIYDGLKPVNRRILVTLHNGKFSKNYIKSARVVGDAMGTLHPHGDSSIYAAMVLMTDNNGSLAFPLVDGSGSFGGFYKTDPPAAMRYTEVKLPNYVVKEYFNEMNGIEMIPNFDSTMSEPELLPVSFPAVLVNSTSGIAVGFKSNIPSFNFVDVCNLVIENIEKGECKTVIAPDFVSGGYYIKNSKELQKLMQTGKAKLKLRGKYVSNGKEINVTELPFGKTIQGLLKQINDKNISAIRNAYDADDFEHGLMFTVDCVNKSRVDEAVYSMYKDTDFQYVYNADITVIKNGSPLQTGVWRIIDEWVKWRREVLTKEYTLQKERLEQEIRESEAFMNVVNAKDRCLELVNIATKDGRQHARDYVQKNFTREEVPSDLINFVSSRSLSEYHDGGKYLNSYNSLKASLEQYIKWLDNIDAAIVEQMKRLITEYGSKFPRLTEVSEDDMEFVEEDGNTKVKVEDSSEVYYAFKGGFLRKCRINIDDKQAAVFQGKANDTLIAFDNRGRLLRIYCSDIPLHGKTDLGTYLPTYLGIEEGNDYNITWIGQLSGATLLLLYSDGNVGFVDTSEWDNSTRRVKVLERGISSVCANKLCAVFEEIPKYLFVTDTSGKLGWVVTSELKRKDRTAKTKVFNINPKERIDSVAYFDEDRCLLNLVDAMRFKDKMKKIKPGDFIGDESIFIPV